MFHGLLEKVGSDLAVSVLSKLSCSKSLEQFSSRLGEHRIYWVRVPGYFCQFTIEPPMAHPERGGKARVRGEVNSIGFNKAPLRLLAHALLNSSTYYLFFCAFTDTVTSIRLM